MLRGSQRSTASRSAALRPCPFVGCPEHLKNMTRDTLIRHLGQCHISSGQPIPQTTLDHLGCSVCAVCRNVKRQNTECHTCLLRQTPSVHTPSPPSPSAPQTPPLGVSPPKLGTPTSEPCPSFSPRLEEVLAHPIPTARHVPRPCRLDFSETLGKLLWEVANRPSWEAVYALCVLPKLVLHQGRRRGEAHPKQQAVDVTRRLTLFQLHDFQRAPPLCPGAREGLD